jgi:hypothetical protein
MRQQKQPQRLIKTGQKTKSFLPWLIVAIIIAITAGLRFRLLDVPLERDEGEYAYAGQLLLQGTTPYDHVYNMKLPGIYVAYAAIMAIFGQSCAGIHLGLLIANTITIVMIFLLVRHLIDSFTGVFAAAAFAVMSIAKSVHGIFANAEHFVILFALPAILLLVLAVDRDSLLLLLTASILLGIGFLMKQHGFAFILFAGLYVFFVYLRRRPFELKYLLRNVALFSIGVILPFGVTCFLLWHLGVFEKFWFWTFLYAREYVSMMPISKGLEFLKTNMLEVVVSAAFIWILAGIGLVTLFRGKQFTAQKPFVVAFLLFSFLSTCPGFYFRKHYFVLLLPAIALLSGIGLFGIRRALGGGQKATIKNIRRRFIKDGIPLFLGLVALSYPLYQQKDFLFAKNPFAASKMIYGFNPFSESLKIAEYIKANSSNDDMVGVIGSEPEIYFYANRRSATSYIYTYPLMEPHPYALKMQEEMIQQIEAAEPKFLVFVNIATSWQATTTSETRIFDWFDQYYQQHYRVVGVIDIVDTDRTIYRWNKDVVNYTLRSNRPQLAVFQRKNRT